MKAFNAYENRGDTRSLVLYLILFQFILFSVAKNLYSISNESTVVYMDDFYV